MKLTITIGHVASGKSTWARAQRDADPDIVLVSRDEIRAMLHGSRFTKENERQTGIVESNIITMALGMGRDVIVHNTHLNPYAVECMRLIRYSSQNIKEIPEFVLKSFLDVPFEVCLERNRGRTNDRVPEEAMLNMKNKWFDSEGLWVGLNQKEINGLVLS